MTNMGVLYIALPGTGHAIFYFPMDELAFTRNQDFYDCMSDAIRDLIDEDDLTITFKVKPLLLDDAEQAVGLNNCFFKKERTIEHDELRFRSKVEIAIYEELKKRNVLFFPNAAAVFGTTEQEFGERVLKKEPDYLICLNGKWGILEINGDDFHSGIAKTTKDHERSRAFKSAHGRSSDMACFL